MKKYIFLSMLAASSAALMTGCDMSEEPKSEASVDMVFNSEKGLQTYAYSFYNVLPDRGGDAYERDATSDYGSKNSIGGMEVGAYTTTSSNSWSWTALRNINYFLEKNTNENVSEAVRNNYNGIARLFRARFYFDKLVQYGEVPWIDKVFNDSDDPDLYNGRDTRDVIIKHILEDLDFAIANMTEKEATYNSTIVNKWVAAAFKARVCLFEAAWRKYHANNELDFARTGCTEYSSTQLYQLAADAAKIVMDGGVYKLHTGTPYANGRGAYRQLFIADKTVTEEVIMAIECDKGLGALGSQNWWYNSSTYGPHLCMTRKFALTYLNEDGTPYNQFNADGTYKTFVQESAGRDLRFNQTVRAADYTMNQGVGYVPTTANFTGHTLSGYQFTKFVLDDASIDNGANNENDIPIMRYAEVLLIYAEAKAELGTLTDAEWAETIGALRARAGITGGSAQTGTLTSKPTAVEPYIAAYYPGVTDPVILEVRRERAIELCLEGQRMNDLKRWNLCNLFVEDPWEGVFIPALNTPLDMNGDGTYDAYFYDTDAIGDATYAPIGVYVGTNKNNKTNVVKVDGGYLMKNGIEGRDWPNRQYLYPVPEVVRQLNSNLTQNPGW